VRRLFIGTMLTSLLGALVIGGVLAWTGSTAATPESATSGVAAAAVYNYVNTPGALVLPTGLDIKVGDAGITNTGNIAVHVTGGTVTNVTYNVGNSGACGVTGSVAVTNPNPIAPGASFAPLYDVFLNMPTTAGDICQNNTIGFDLTINVAT
jgi:hypothetical protein